MPTCDNRSSWEWAVGDVGAYVQTYVSSNVYTYVYIYIYRRTMCDTAIRKLKLNLLPAYYIIHFLGWASSSLAIDWTLLRMVLSQRKTRMQAMCWVQTVFSGGWKILDDVGKQTANSYTIQYNMVVLRYCKPGWFFVATGRMHSNTSSWRNDMEWNNG